MYDREHWKYSADPDMIFHGINADIGAWYYPRRSGEAVASAGFKGFAVNGKWTICAGHVRERMHAGTKYYNLAWFDSFDTAYIVWKLQGCPAYIMCSNPSSPTPPSSSSTDASAAEL